jgi:hypothetical protein
LVGFCLVYFFFTGSSWGSLEVSSPSIFSRGSGQLLFPFLFWGLLAGWGCIKAGQIFSRQKNSYPTPAILGWFAAWAALLLMHSIWAMVSGIEVRDALSPLGFSNIPWMGVVIMVMIACGTSERAMDRISKMIVVLALVRALFGLVRWAAFGGDPANVYEHNAGIGIKLTFFDINDGLLCVLGLTISVLYLFAEKQRLKIHKVWKALFAATALACLICIVFSYRRTEWGGLVLVAIYIVSRLPKEKRLPIAMFGLPVLLAGIVTLATIRLSQTHGAFGLLGFVHDLLPSKYGTDNDRVLELRYTMETFLNNLIAGVGAWGSYEGSNRIAWQQGSGSGGSFVHSGFLHIALKTGLVGLGILAGTIGAFMHHVRRLPKDLSLQGQVLIAAGIAGLLFMLPDFFIGTPIPQVRTTQMIAFCIGLPYLVSAALMREGKIA